MSTYAPSVEQITDGNGKPIVGARKHFFEIGTTTFKTIYSDPALTTPLTNPVKSDADGRYPTIYLDGLYKVVQEDASGTDLFLLDGTTLWTEEQVGESPSTTQFALWDTTATYNIPDIVLGSDDNYYRSLTDTNTGNNPTTTATSWELLIFGREWNTNVTYAVGDVVYGTDGLLYTSRTAANLGNDPTSDLVNWNGKLKHNTVSGALNTLKQTDAATGVNPKIGSDGEANTGLIIEDSNSNEIIIAESVASAVNEITVTNAATTNKPSINQTGEDVGLSIEGVDIHNGVFTAGINLGNETMSNYDEGTWTPTIQDSTYSDAEGQTYTSQIGNYTRIGNIVFFSFQISITSTGTLTGADPAYIGGLPIATTGVYLGGMTCTVGTSLSTTATATVTGIPHSGDTSSISLQEWSTAGTSTVTITELSPTATLAGFGWYIA